MKLKGTQDQDKAEVQMAPLIDCVFILLIFFLVTSMLLKPHMELAVDVPDSGTANAKTEQAPPLVIELSSINPDEDARRREQAPNREPFILLGNETLDRQMLERRLRSIAQQTPDRRVRIDAHGHMAWRHVVPIIDLCRYHGLIHVDIRTI